ncbi:MAG: hypothetical protein PVI26_09195, partial [Chitinispirillia bacterium]|jgi:hypothetical protein
MTVVGWIGIAGNFFLIWENKRSQVNIHYSITIFLIMVGVYLWFIPLIYIVSRLGRMMSNKIKTTLVIVSGSFLVLFGLSAFYYVYALLRYYF